MIEPTIDEGTTSNTGDVLLLVDYCLIDMEPVPEKRPPWFGKTVPPWGLCPGAAEAAPVPIHRPRRVQVRGVSKPNFGERGKG